MSEQLPINIKYRLMRMNWPQATIAAAPIEVAAYNILYDYLFALRINKSSETDMVIEADISYLSDFDELQHHILKISTAHNSKESLPPLKKLLKSDFKQLSSIQELIVQQGDTVEDIIKMGSQLSQSEPDTAISQSDDVLESDAFEQAREEFVAELDVYKSKQGIDTEIATTSDTLLAEIDTIASTYQERRPELAEVLEKSTAMLRYENDVRSTWHKAGHDLHVTKYNYKEFAGKLQKSYPVLRTVANLFMTLISTVAAGAAASLLTLHPPGIFAASAIAGGVSFYNSVQSTAESRNSCRLEASVAEKMSEFSRLIKY